MKYLNSRDFGIIIKTMGDMLSFMSLILFIPAFVAFYYFIVGKVNFFELLMYFVPGVLSYIVGYFFREYEYTNKKDGIKIKVSKDESILRSKIAPKHALLTSALLWLLLPLFGTVPFLLYGFSPLDAYFESAAGFTTTGMSLITHIESYPEPLLFFRSFMEWLGGVGVIVLFLILLMRPGTAISKLYSSEARGERIKPSIRGTAVEIWKIYAFLTLICIVILYLVGMTPFDAINHGMTTVSTGGLSTHDESIAYFNNYPGSSPLLIKITLIIFMIIGATSFLVHFKILGGDLGSLIRNPEFKFMIAAIIISTALVWGTLNFVTPGSIIDSSGDILFQMVAMITGTGYTSVGDMHHWDAIIKVVVLIFMIMGGCYGSTTGGLKIIRMLIMLKIVWRTIKKSLMPESSVVPVSIMGKPVTDDEVSYVASLIMVYLMLSIAAIAVFTTMGYDELESTSLAVSALSNVGPTFLAPDQWFGIGEIEKIVLIFLMYAGRLEIFPVLVLITTIIKRGKL